MACSKRPAIALEDELQAAQQAGEALLPLSRWRKANIADVVARWTGIPMQGGCWPAASQKLLELENRLAERVIASPRRLALVAAIASAGPRPACRIRDGRLGVPFLFLRTPTGRSADPTRQGPGGGRCSMRRGLVRPRYGRIHGAHNGRGPGCWAPLGLRGYEEGGQLTEAIRRRPMPCCCSMRWRRPTT